MGAKLQAQPYNYSNLRTKKIATAKSLFVDSFSIVPRTFFIKQLDTSFYELDVVNAQLIWKKTPELDSVDVIYRVFGYKLNAVVKRYSYDSVMNNFKAEPFVFNRNRRQANGGNLFDFGTMNYNGSFGRALSFGNNQDVVVNSQFNLQLSGLIGDSIEVAAAITDNNIPLQPDGTTQQLNEFDRVWLQFKKNGWEANLGDIDIRQNSSYFLNFYKRVQGISYSTQTKPGKQVINKTLVSGAIAKGKFTRNIFQGQEGNQGPYRLQGANNEFFFIVLAGTERVFIDGQLLQRGEDQDYVINYNTAEIAFTPRRMITKDARIQVEFEYADRNYLNSLLYANNETIIDKKLTLNISAYSNSDAKNSPINQTLDTRQRQFLSNIGDSINRAFYPSASLDTFEVGKILYARIDTVYNGGIADSIYVFSTDKNTAKYNLGFVEVGFGRGNYVPDFNAANGKVFRWVAPLNGLPQGNFEPATYLVTPKQQQLFAIAAVYDLSAKNQLKADVALSKYDVNTFSGKDKTNDRGLATKLAFMNSSNWHSKRGKSFLLNTTAGYEMVDKKFKPLERLRSVEFYRDWGLDFQPAPATEHLPSLNIRLIDTTGNSIQYQFTGYIRDDNYTGMRHSLVQQQKVGGWQFNNIFNLTSIRSAINKGFFLRPIVDVSKVFKKVKYYTAGASYVVEHNELRNKFSETLSPLSFAFTTITTYIKSNQAKDNRWGLSYFTRVNQIPVGKNLETTDRSHNINLSTELLGNSKHQFRANVTYRQLQVINQRITTLQPENSVLGRMEYLINEWKGFVRGNMLYELGAGQEQRRDFSYIEVPSGRGEYAWNDYNNDGIPQINEFEIALFQDQAKYIRVFTPTNQFVKANYTQFNYTITLNPKSIIGKIANKRTKDLLGRFNMQSSLQTAKKVLASGALTINPFKGGIMDTSLITLNNVLANTLSFNRFSIRWGMDISNSRNYNKSLLTYGFESRQLNDWALKGRVNITRKYSIELLQKLATNSLFTPSFANRNFLIDILTSEPRFTFTEGTKYRIQTSYQFSKKQNTQLYGGERSTTNSINIDGKYNTINNTSLNGRFTYSNIFYTGATNSTVSYIMLDALLPGKNFLWNLELTKRLGNNLELNFQYEGRKPGETRTIHTGRASLRALL